MFKVGDLVTPKNQYVNSEKVFKIIEIDIIRRQYKIEACETLFCIGPSTGWEENELDLIRTIESLTKEHSTRIKGTSLNSVIQETVRDFHLGIKYKSWESRNVNDEPTPEFPQEIEYGYKWVESMRKNMEVKDMSKILEIYKDKKVKEIEQKYDEQLKELEENDPVKVYLKQAEETIKEMLNVEDITLCINSPYVGLTQETIDAKNKIIETIRNGKREIDDKIKEIEALLELAPGYEEKIKILRDYEIIDKKKNVIL